MRLEYFSTDSKQYLLDRIKTKLSLTNKTNRQMQSKYSCSHGECPKTKVLKIVYVNI